MKTLFCGLLLASGLAADCPAGTVPIPMYEFLFCYDKPNGETVCEMETFYLCFPYVWDLIFKPLQAEEIDGAAMPKEIWRRKN